VKAHAGDINAINAQRSAGGFHQSKEGLNMREISKIDEEK
jgi:hypothetical protein